MPQYLTRDRKASFNQTEPQYGDICNIYPWQTPARIILLIKHSSILGW